MNKPEDRKLFGNGIIAPSSPHSRAGGPVTGFALMILVLIAGNFMMGSQKAGPTSTEQNLASTVSPSKDMPRKTLEFVFLAELLGVKGRYERHVDISENSHFYVTDRVGPSHWTTAARFGSINEGQISVRLYVTWILNTNQSGSFETDMIITIGDQPRAVPEDHDAIKARAAILPVEPEPDSEDETGIEPPTTDPPGEILPKRHPGRLVLESYIISLRTNSYRVFRSSFEKKSDEYIPKSRLGQYHSLFRSKYPDIQAKDCDFFILGQTENEVTYTVRLKTGNPLDIPFLKTGTLVRVSANAWKISW